MKFDSYFSSYVKFNLSGLITKREINYYGSTRRKYRRICCHIATSKHSLNHAPRTATTAILTNGIASIQQLSTE
jgi:hypothetical protein